jgi:hypothetical protein
LTQKPNHVPHGAPFGLRRAVVVLIVICCAGGCHSSCADDTASTPAPAADAAAPVLGKQQVPPRPRFNRFLMPTPRAAPSASVK